MNGVSVVIEHRYEQTPDGAVWTSSCFGYTFFLRYLDVFDRVGVVARSRQAAVAPQNWQRADGEGVIFKPVPYYLGPWQYLLKAWQVRRAVRDGIGATDAVILRLDSQLAASVDSLFWGNNRPYGAEVVVDPFDVFSPGSIEHPLRPFFRWWFSRKLRKQCGRACAVSYVTQRALQVRYPPNPCAFTTHYSSVELPEEAFAKEGRPVGRDVGKYALVTVTMLDQLRKAPDVVIDAVGECVRAGLNLQLTIIGDGKYRSELEIRAAKLGLGGRIRFTGWLPGRHAVCQELDKADLFVLPSRGEGLPRALLEAMARGLPAIGSRLAGFHELLPPEDLVPAGDVIALTHKMSEVLKVPERMAAMSARNLRKAKEYDEDILRRRRIAFYNFLKERTSAWLKNH